MKSGTFWTSKVYKTPSGSGKYIGFELRIETGAERTTVVNVDIFDIIQQVRDTDIHLKIDEEQWKITQGSKRQAKWVWSPSAMSGLRLPDTPHSCTKIKQTTVHSFRPETRERRSIWWPTNDTHALCLEQTKMTINS